MKFHIPEQTFSIEEGGYVRLKIEAVADEVAPTPEVAPEVALEVTPEPIEAPQVDTPAEAEQAPAVE